MFLTAVFPNLSLAATPTRETSSRGNVPVVESGPGILDDVAVPIVQPQVGPQIKTEEVEGLVSHTEFRMIVQELRDQCRTAPVHTYHE